MSKAIDKARRAAARSEVQKRVFTTKLLVRRAAARDGMGDPADDIDASAPAGDLAAKSYHVAGHAAVFNTVSQPLYDWWEGSFVEMVVPGAFAKTINEADIRFLINHEPNLVCARTKSGTLRLSEDEIGLAVDADLAPVSYVDDLCTLMAREDVTQMSIMFTVLSDDWTGTRNGLPLRVINEVKLFDVSAVTFPAFEETDIGMRSQDVSALLRSLGLADIPAERRGALIAALTRGVPIPTDLAPVLRAARDALGTLATNTEPVDDHSGRSFGLAKEKFRLKARETGLPERVA